MRKIVICQKPPFKGESILPQTRESFNHVLCEYLPAFPRILKTDIRRQPVLRGGYGNLETQSRYAPPPSALTYQPHAGDRETRTCAFEHKMERSRRGGESQ